MRSQTKPSYLMPILLFAGMILALQWPQIKQLFWKETFPEPAFTWQADFASAQKMAKEKQQNLLVVFSASWCPPCKRMKQQVWPDPKVGAVVQANYVPVYVDIDEPENERLVNKYQVQGIPAIFILDAEGALVRQTQTMSRSETVTFLSAN